MSTCIPEKLKLMRESERLKMKEVADLAGINYVTYVGYESGKSKLAYDACVKIFKLPRFRKYQSWFMYDEVDPEAGQIAPALAHYGQNEITSPFSDKKTG